MCGITGIVGRGATEAALSASAHALRHRGPDGHGTYVNRARTVGLAHTRLAVIDLETGAQPLFSEDRKIVLVANGEIYDYERIRKRLAGMGHRFSTASDSEVLIYLYRAYGLEGMFEHIRGELAFLLYDSEREVVIAARDRFGIKPLYVSEVGGNYVFSSEAKGIFATGLVRGALDVCALRDTFLGLSPDSIFERVGVVEPGTYLRIDVANGRASSHRYWDIDLPLDSALDSTKDVSELATEVRDVFDEAVALRLRADVPVGVYLSGGIDSSSVAATVAERHAGALHAFTIAFTDDRKFNELERAQRMASSIGVHLHVAECSNARLLEHLKESLWFAESPIENLHGVGLFLLSELARRHVTVVLNGQGADETFLGYELFKLGDVADARSGLLPEDRAVMMEAKAQLGILGLPLRAYLAPAVDATNAFFRREHAAALSQSDHLASVRRRFARDGKPNQSQARELQTYFVREVLQPYILTVLGDRPEMAHSLEGRVPFLDHHLFEVARRLPDSVKVRAGVEKYVLREAMKGRVIPEILSTKKWIFHAPPVQLDATPAESALFDHYLSESSIDKVGIFEPAQVRQVRSLFAQAAPGEPQREFFGQALLRTVSIQMLAELFA